MCRVQGSAPGSGLGACWMEELVGSSGKAKGHMLICFVSCLRALLWRRVRGWGGCPREPCALDGQRACEQRRSGA